MSRRVCIQIGSGIDLRTVPETTKSLSITKIVGGKSAGSDDVLADVMTVCE